MLDHCYAKFDKPFFASLCAKLAKIADAGDELSLHLFNEAGRYLAKATSALLPNVSEQLLTNGNLNIVCVGSVWKSWHLLKAGYTKEIATSNCSFGLNLLNLTQTMAIGAAYIAADSIKFNLPRNYAHNYEIFHYVPRTDGVVKTNGTAAYTNGVGSAKKCNGTSLKNGTATKKATTNGTTNGTPILVTDG